MAEPKLKHLPSAVAKEARAFVRLYTPLAVENAEAQVKADIEQIPELANVSETQKAILESMAYAEQFVVRLVGESIMREKALKARLDTMQDEILALQVRE